MLSKKILTFNVGKCAECSSRTITGVLNVITFGRFVNFGMKLLLRPGMAVLAGITSITTHRITPFVSRFDIRAWSGPGEKNRGKI